MNEGLSQFKKPEKVKITPLLKDLYQHITPQYAADWEVIGTLLGLPSGELKAIKAGNPTEVKWCCNQMLGNWLETDTTASWERLFTVIESPAVSCSAPDKASPLCVKKDQQVSSDLRAASSQQSERLLDDEESDQVPEDVLNRLEHSRKLQEILQNRELQDLIREIDGHSRPPDKLKIAMQLPVFREFVDECLAVCDQSNNNTSPDTSYS